MLELCTCANITNFRPEVQNVGRTLGNCTFTGLAALLPDWVRARCEGAGLALTADHPIGADACSTVVSWVVETLSVSVGLLFKHTV